MLGTCALNLDKQGPCCLLPATNAFQQGSVLDLVVFYPFFSPATTSSLVYEHSK